MSDLVERLRSRAPLTNYVLGLSNTPEALYAEAADHIEALEDEAKRTKELHAAIRNLEGSEGMTDAKFAKWVLAALNEIE